MDSEVLENHKKHVQRLEFYRSFGYDQDKERDFILDAAMPVSGDILEIGTGKGHFALALARRGLPFTSIDISGEEQRFAELNLRYLGLEKLAVLRIEDAEKLSFPGRSFDVVFSVNVFHHLCDPAAVMDEIIRVSRPGARIVLSDFTEEGLEIINRCHTHEGRTHDYFQHRLEEARGYLSARGFLAAETQSRVQRVIIFRRAEGSIA